jgi:hypothetical protein
VANQIVAFFKHLPFCAEVLVLPPEPAEFLALVGRQATRPLLEPSVDTNRNWLTQADRDAELLRE